MIRCVQIGNEVLAMTWKAKLFDGAETEMFFRSHPGEKFGIARGFGSETPFFAHADPKDRHISRKYRLFQKFFRRKSRKLTGEIDRHDGFDSIVMQQTHLFVTGIQQTRRIFRQQAPRMRIKCHNYRITIKFRGDSQQFRQQFLMSPMDAVKNSDRDNRPVYSVQGQVFDPVQISWNEFRHFPVFPFLFPYRK